MEYGQKLYRLTDGKINEQFERTVEDLYGQRSDVWGAYMPLTSFLHEREQMESKLFELASTFWQYIHKNNIFLFRTLGLDWQFVNERLEMFFKSSKNKERFFQYVRVHRQITFESLYYFIFERHIHFPQAVSNLVTIHLYEVAGQFFIQPIFQKNYVYWQHLFAKKVYAIFMQITPVHIDEPLKLMTELQKALHAHYTKKQTAKIIYKLVQHLIVQNEKSLQLKQLEMFNVLSHFTGGRHYVRKLSKAITQFGERWTEGEWCLTDKEQTLLMYLLMCEAYEKRDYKATCACGQFLLEENRIFNHAVEILMDYAHFFNSYNPQPNSLIKNYKANYLEYAFYMLIHANTQLGRFGNVYTLLKEYEVACCTAIYQYLNEEEHSVTHAKLLKQTMRADIVSIVKKDDEKKALAYWKAHTADDYKKDVKTSSKMVCNILKMAYVFHEEPLFSTLYPLYKKYLCVPQHEADLRQFMKKARPAIS